VSLVAARVEAGGAVARGFFTPKGSLVTVTDVLRDRKEAAVSWADGADRQDKAEIVRRGKDVPQASLLKLESVRPPLRTFAVGSTEGLKVGARVERYLGPDARRQGTVIEAGAERRIAGTLVRNLLVTTRISAGDEAGAPIVDAEGRLIGMVYASSETETYALAIEGLESSFADEF
jgi:hypothetical protein